MVARDASYCGGGAGNFRLNYVLPNPLSPFSNDGGFFLLCELTLDCSWRGGRSIGGSGMDGNGLGWLDGSRENGHLLGFLLMEEFAEARLRWVGPGGGLASSSGLQLWSLTTALLYLFPSSTQHHASFWTSPAKSNGIVGCGLFSLASLGLGEVVMRVGCSKSSKQQW